MIGSRMQGSEEQSACDGPCCVKPRPQESVKQEKAGQGKSPPKAQVGSLPGCGSGEPNVLEPPANGLGDLRDEQAVAIGRLSASFYYLHVATLAGIVSPSIDVYSVYEGE